MNEIAITRTADDWHILAHVLEEVRIRMTVDAAEGSQEDIVETIQGFLDDLYARVGSV